MWFVYQDAMFDLKRTTMLGIFSWLTDVHLPQTSCVQSSAPQSQSRIMSWQHMPTPCIVYTPDLEQSGRHDTIQARPETEISLWATLFNTLRRQPDTAAHRGRGVGLTARYNNSILPLPAQPVTVMLTETDAQTRLASKHARAYT